MLTEEQAKRILDHEIRFHTSRSGGKGGQNVNKVETKVELEFDVASSESLSDNDKAKILHNYKNLVAGTLIKITGTEHRTQLRNKEAAGEKLIALLNKLLKPTKKRLATKPGKAAKEKKLKFKKIKSEKKQLRQKIR